MDIQFWQILFQLVNFGVVTGALTFLLFKPVKKMLQDRSDRVAEGQKAAEAALAEKHAIDEMKRKSLKATEEETTKMLEEASVAVAQRKKQLWSEAKMEVLAEVEKLRQNWEVEKKGMKAELQKEFAQAVFSTVEKVVGSFDKKAHSKLIDEELDALLERI